VQYYKVKENPHFVGRDYYRKRLREIDAEAQASIIVVYGRRRVGKTELIEQFFKGRPILKFEGLQPQDGVTKKGQTTERKRQIRACLTRLGGYLDRATEYQLMKVDRWTDFFALLTPLIADTPTVLYLEELQWMAHYGNDLLAEFKPFWDDTLRHNPNLRVVISGSSTSFITKQFLSSSAMYNRSNHMIKLEPFNLGETREFLGKGVQETLLAAIALGGIPEYLKQVKTAPSVYIGLCNKSFRPGEFFRVEKDCVFVSSLAFNRFYEGIIDYLALHKYADRQQLHDALSDGRASPGGSFTTILDELVDLDFVERYVPITTRNSARSHQARYAISDEYLQFYYRMIAPRKRDIDRGKFATNPGNAINRQDFSKLLGFAFERWCRKHEDLIAQHMRFGGVVDYTHGSWYDKSKAQSSLARDAQIDLMYIRKDSKLIICEIKYNNDSTLTRKVMRDTQDKVDLFLERNPKYARYTVETALITTEPAPDGIRNEGYFTYMIDTEQLFKASSAL
jgi:hypothetical protein